MSLSKAQQKRILDVAIIASTWKYDRLPIRSLFDSIERTEGCSVRGYVRLLEKAQRALRKAIAALNILEAND
jgi:hypothetical protein